MNRNKRWMRLYKRISHAPVQHFLTFSLPCSRRERQANHQIKTPLKGETNKPCLYCRLRLESSNAPTVSVLSKVGDIETQDENSDSCTGERAQRTSVI